MITGIISGGANEELGDRLADPIGKNGYAVGNDSTEQAMDGYMTEDEKYETVNKINQEFVDIIRESGGNNASRHLLIPGYNTNIDKTVDAEHTVTVTDKDGTAIKDEDGKPVKKKVGNRFVMPTDLEANGKTKLFLSVHYYTPWEFCGDGGTGKYTTTVTDVMLTQDGTYTVSIEGAKITGTKYQMLGLLQTFWQRSIRVSRSVMQPSP